MTATSYGLTIDRFEGELAVVVFDDGVVLDMPRAMLPPDVREGDRLRGQARSAGPAVSHVEFTIEQVATEERRRAVADRLLRLKALDAGEAELG